MNSGWCIVKGVLIMLSGFSDWQINNVDVGRVPRTRRFTTCAPRDKTMESIFEQSEESKVFVKDLCFEFAGEAASLWLARQKAVDAPHCNLADLLEMDNRLEAQIDALRVAGVSGWESAFAQVKPGQPETFFASCVLALEICDENRIGIMLEKAATTPEALESIISALGWIKYEQAQTHIQKLLASGEAVDQYIGIAASAFHRRDPGIYLDNGFYASDIRLKARSLRAAGEIGGRIDKLTPGHLYDQLQSADRESRFWAAWSVALLGDAWSANMYGTDESISTPSVHHAVNILRSFVIPEFPFREAALNLAMRLVDRTNALIWGNELILSKETLRLAVIGAGIRGDVVKIPFLIDMMQIPVHARVAGEAFTMITGIDLKDAQLEGHWPEGFEAGPNDDPKDDNVKPDPDENLPWPDVQRIAAWWKKNKDRYPEETRLLLGKPVTEENATHVLSTGKQRQRAAAALELAILNPGRALYNTAAPAWRQMPDVKPQPTPAIAPNYGSRPLAITAVNCITPLGHSAEMTAAAVRAGITRFVLSDVYQDSSGNPINAASIQGLSLLGDTPDRHLSDIAVMCQDILFEKYYEKIRQWPLRAQLFLCASSEKRFGPEYGEACQRSLTRVLAERVSSPSVKMINKGNASLHYAVQETAKLIQVKPDTMCVIVCIDSLLDNATLNWLENTNSLKSSSFGRQSGLIPSEAVAFVIVEDLENAKKANKTILTRITSLGLSEEPHCRVSEQSGISKGLTEACNTALQPLKKQNICAVFSDLSGEEDRAREWGIVRQRIFDKDQNQPPLWTPADTYGDISAASGGVLACIVAEGFKRNWLPSPVMIICSDDHGSCGAVILEKECPPPAEVSRSDGGGS